MPRFRLNLDWSRGLTWSRLPTYLSFSWNPRTCGAQSGVAAMWVLRSRSLWTLLSVRTYAELKIYLLSHPNGRCFMHIGSYFADEPHHHYPFISRAAFIMFQPSDAEGWLCFFFLADHQRWYPAPKNCQSSRRLPLDIHDLFWTITSRPWLTLNMISLWSQYLQISRLETPRGRRIQHLRGVASSSLLTEIECLS